MTCSDAREALSALLDEVLTPGERAEVEAHLGDCPDCRRELEGLRRTVALLRGVEPVSAPAGFVDRVLVAARPMPWPRRLARRLFVPLPVKLPIEAAAVVLVAVAAVYLHQRTPEVRQAAHQEAPLSPSVPPGPSAGAPAAVPAPAPRPTPPARSNEAKDRLSALREVQPPLPRAPAGGGETVSPKKAPPAGSPLAKTSPSASAPASPPGRRDDASRETAVTGSATMEQRAALQAQPISGVSGLLEVSNREAAVRGLADLVEGLGGAEVARRADPTGTVVELIVPRSAYPALLTGLGRLGTWRLGQAATELPADEVRVEVRVTDAP